MIMEVWMEVWMGPWALRQQRRLPGFLSAACGQQHLRLPLPCSPYELSGPTRCMRVYVNIYTIVFSHVFLDGKILRMFEMLVLFS